MRTGAAPGMAEPQPQEIAEAETSYALGSVEAEPCGSAALGDQGGDRPVHRGDARIAPLEVWNDDLEFVEGVVPEFRRHALPPPTPPFLRPVPRLCGVIELPVHRLGHQRIDRAGRRVDEPRPAAQEKAVPEKDAQEIDRRVEQQLEPRRLLAEGEALLRLKPGVDDFLPHLLIERQAPLVAEKTLACDCGLAVGDKAFVDKQVGLEAGASAPDQPDDMFRAGPEADRSEPPVKRQRAANLPTGERRVRCEKGRER